MALRQIRIGSLIDIHQYDDGDYDKSIEVEDPIKCSAAPTDGSDVLRLDDVGASVGDVYGPAISVDSDLVEFDGVTGKTLKDGGLSHVSVAASIAASHARLHAISSTSDHSDVNLAGIANNDLMQWDDPNTKWVPKSIAEVVSGQNISPGNVDSSGVFKVSGTQVVGAQQLAEADLAAVPDCTGADTIDQTTLESYLGDIRTTLNNLLAKLRTHGLIDT